MKYIIGQLLSWQSVRHNACVLVLRYLRRHAHGTFSCVWNHVPHTAIWIGTITAHLHR